MTIYSLIALAVLIENVFPPTPSDFIVALGAFASHQGGVRPFAVFMVAWVANTIGAVLVYHLARRYGRGFFAGRIGRRLLTPAAIVTMEREYIRFGVMGLFLARLLPGLRSFVSPFAGLINLHPLKAMIPITLAAGLQYAIFAWIGARLGDEWETIHRFLQHLNRSLAIVAGVVVLGVGLWFLLRRRRTREQRLWSAVGLALGRGPATDTEGAAAAGASILLLELARDDREIPVEDQTAIERRLRDRWSIAEGKGIDASKEVEGERPARDTKELGARIADTFDLGARRDLAERLWRIAQTEGTLSRHEDLVMRRAGDLLGLSVEDLAEARRRVVP